MFTNPDGTVTYLQGTVPETPTPSASQLKRYDSSISCNVECAFDEPDQSDWDAADARQLKGKTITTCGMQSLARICKNMKPPMHPDHIASYRQWLLYDSSESQNLSEELLPMERHSTLDVGLKLPYPSGHNWCAALAALDPDEESTACALRACLRDSYRELKDLK